MMSGRFRSRLVRQPPDERQVMEEINESTESLLMEGVRLLDEINRIAKNSVSVPVPLTERPGPPRGRFAAVATGLPVVNLPHRRPEQVPRQ